MPAKTKNTTVKNCGRVYTPEFIVKNILDFCGYAGDAVFERHIIDNSCGCGAFLAEAVSRYVRHCVGRGLDAEVIRRHLETYVHGIEIDEAVCGECRAALDAEAAKYGINDVAWDVVCGDALRIGRFDGRMDFVVGNPPYVRVHNLDDSYEEVKGFSFASDGMTDMYLVFYELGLRMLSPQGRLCYIAPGSWLTSLAGQKMREHILREKDLAAVVDLEHFQPFKATAYTLIALFVKGYGRACFDYYRFDERVMGNRFVDTLNHGDVCISSCFYLSTPETLRRLRQIKSQAVPKYVSVKNGFATLADNFFIGSVPESPFTINIIKASTGKWSRCLFPYDDCGREIPQEQLFAVPEVRRYYMSNRGRLDRGGKDSTWLYFGRTQAIKDVQYDKIAVNTLVKDRISLKINRVGKSNGMYSGLYILYGDISPDTITEIIDSDEFIDYIRSLKKYKSGGYYTFNSKDLEQYLNCKLFEKNIKFDVCANADQRRLFEGYNRVV